MTEHEVTLLLYKASSAYPNQIELKDDTINVWVERLANFPADKALRNLNSHIDSNRFFPCVADIIKHDPDVWVDYEAQRLESRERFARAALEQRDTPLVSDEEREDIRRRAEAGEYDEKYRNEKLDPWA